jgi:hypothetical protein
VTPGDVDELRRKGAWMLVTSTPSMAGRSFGTNVIEALLVVMAKGDPESMTPDAYEAWITRLGLEPRIEELNPRPS